MGAKLVILSQTSAEIGIWVIVIVVLNTLKTITIYWLTVIYINLTEDRRASPWRGRFCRILHNNTRFQDIRMTLAVVAQFLQWQTEDELNVAIRPHLGILPSPFTKSTEFTCILQEYLRNLRTSYAAGDLSLSHQLSLKYYKSTICTSFKRFFIILIITSTVFPN